MLHWGVGDFAIGEFVHVRIVHGNTQNVIYEGVAKVTRTLQDRGFSRLTVDIFGLEKDSKHCMSYEDQVRKLTKLDKYLAGIYD
jgi:hypothetical protein